MDRTHDGRSIRMLTLIDEYARECLTIDVARKINAMDVVERLADLFVYRGIRNTSVRIMALNLSPGK